MMYDHSSADILTVQNNLHRAIALWHR